MNMLTKVTVIVLLVTAFCCRSAADVVVPVESVDSFVNIRLEPDAQSEIVGRLQQGARLNLLQSVDGWHQVALEGGGSGYVSADWSLVIGDDSVPPAESVAAESPAPESESDAAAEPGEIAEPEVVAATEVVAEADELPDAGAATESAAAAAEPAHPDHQASSEEPAEDAIAADEAIDPQTTSEPAEPEQESEQAVEPAPAAEPVVVATVPSYAAPTAGPGAEGSVDRIARFITPKELGNSQIYDDGRNVGIGTSAPKQRLEVNGNIQIHEQNSNMAGLIISQSSGDSGYIMHNRANTLTIGAGSVDRITITRDGNTGFGVNRPSHPIETSSGAYVSTGGVWTNSSSRDKKENVRELTPEEALAALVLLQPVRFNYKTDKSEEYAGFIAEDVPDLVATGDRTSLSAMDIVAVLTSVVQQQQKKIDDLEARLDLAIAAK